MRVCVAGDENFSVLSLNMKPFELCTWFKICTNPVFLSLSRLKFYSLDHC